MKKYLIKVNGNQYEVEVEELKHDHKYISKEKETKSYAPVALVSPKHEAGSVAGKHAESGQSDSLVSGVHIKAPMPGTVLIVNAKIGDLVKKDQVLVVLEAMKMENELVAPEDGSVKAINAEAGKTVSVGDILVTLEIGG